MLLDPSLLEIVRCPKCKGKVTERAEGQGGPAALVCAACRVGYPIVDGIPNLLADEGVPLP